MNKLEKLILKGFTNGRYLTHAEEAEMKQLHKEHMIKLSSHIWDIKELKRMRRL